MKDSLSLISELALSLSGMDVNTLGYDAEKYIKQAEANNLVVAHVDPYETLQLSGAWDDDIGIPGNVCDYYVNKGGPILNECECTDCPYYRDLLLSSKHVISVRFNDTGKTWVVTINVPHQSFVIYDGDGVFGLGVVFSIDDIK